MTLVRWRTACVSVYNVSFLFQRAALPDEGSTCLRVNRGSRGHLCLMLFAYPEVQRKAHLVFLCYGHCPTFAAGD